MGKKRHPDVSLFRAVSPWGSELRSDLGDLFP